MFSGAFQALMPFIGHLGGKGVLRWVDAYAYSFGLLALIGAKLVYEGLHRGVEEDIVAITKMMMPAIASSIDATAGGFSKTARHQRLAGDQGGDIRRGGAEPDRDQDAGCLACRLWRQRHSVAL